MATWRGKNLYDVYYLMRAENDEALRDTQVRGWAALAETYLEEYNNLGDLKTKLAEVWTSESGDAYLATLDKVKEQLYNAWSNAYDNAYALDSIASQIGAAQYVLQDLIDDFEVKMDGKWNQYYADVKETQEWHDSIPGFGDDPPKEPNRDELLNDPELFDGEGSFNDAMGRVMDSTMSSVQQTWLQDFWTPTAYNGPRRSQEPTGMPPGMNGPGAGPSPGSMGGPRSAPPAPNLTPPKMSQLSPTATPTPDRPNVTNPPPNTRPTVPTVTPVTTTTATPRPGTAPSVAPVTRPAARVAPTAPGVTAPGTSPASSRTSAVSPRTASPSGLGSAPGKPPAGKMAPPPSAMSPRGGAPKALKPNARKPGTTVPPGGVPGKPGAGKMAPPPGGIGPRSSPKTGKQPGVRGRAGGPGSGMPPGVPGRMNPSGGKPRSAAPGKPGATGGPTRSGAVRPNGPAGGNGPFPPTPHIGSKQGDKPNRPTRGGKGGKDLPPSVGLPGRVTRQGGTQPVLSGRGPNRSAPTPRGMGIPSSLTPLTRKSRVSMDAPGVIRPAEEKPVTTPYQRTPRDDKKRQEMLKNPLTAEFIKANRKLAGMRTPVLDTDPEVEQPDTGPVLGYSGKA